MHTRAFSNVLNEFLLRVEETREREREQDLHHFPAGHFQSPWRHTIDNRIYNCVAEIQSKVNTLLHYGLIIK